MNYVDGYEGSKQREKDRIGERNLCYGHREKRKYLTRMERRMSILTTGYLRVHGQCSNSSHYSRHPRPSPHTWRIISIICGESGERNIISHRLIPRVSRVSSRLDHGCGHACALSFILNHIIPGDSHHSSAIRVVISVHPPMPHPTKRAPLHQIAIGTQRQIYRLTTPTPCSTSSSPRTKHLNWGQVRNGSFMCCPPPQNRPAAVGVNISAVLGLHLAK
jgi:hypothetical protein